MSNSPITQQDVDIFIDNPKNRHVLNNGSNTSRMAWRVIRWQHFRLRDVERERDEWKARYEAVTGTSETKWQEKVG